MTDSSRRDFLKISGVLAAGVCVGAQAVAAEPLPMPVGLQLYSVRELLPKDFDGTLHKLAAAGYKEMEAAGYFNKTAAEWKHSMDAAGLHCISSHHPLAMLNAKADELIEYGHAIGLEYMICSWAGVHRNPTAKGELTLDDWRYVADQFNAIGEKVKAAGMQFGYHNHTIEFGKENGVVFYDELLKRTDPKLVKFEMDCGWVVAAGADPVEYLTKYPDRFPLFHVKCLARQADGKYRSVVMGHGIPDYHAIFRANPGLKQYFIEQEEFTGDPMDELRQDAAFMKSFSV